MVQETFLTGWQALRTLKEPSSFRSWLVMIARRKALQYNETRARREQTMDDLVSFPAEEPAGEEIEDLRQQLHWALRQLPEKYRIPLTLRYLEGFDYRKISDTLGISDGSMRGLLNRGMQLLKQQVKMSARI